MSRQCPDCNVEMEVGFVPDFAFNMVGQMAWHRDEPTEATMLGVKTGGVKVDGKNLIGIIAYRCPTCELVRLYAPSKA